MASSELVIGTLLSAHWHDANYRRVKFTINPLPWCLHSDCVGADSLNYFARTARVKPSSKKFKDLGVEILDQSYVQKLIPQLPSRNVNAKAALLFQHKKKFDMWRLHLE